MLKLDFKNVLIVPKKTSIKSRKDVSLKRTIKFKSGKTWTGVPIISSNMDSVTNLTTCKILGERDYISCLPKHLNEGFMQTPFEPEMWRPDTYMLSCGSSRNDVNRLLDVSYRLFGLDIDTTFICVDVANGYTKELKDACKKIRDYIPNVVLVAGNVVTPDGVFDLIDAGVDIVKVGIGSGSVCETRLKAGVGYPQLSAVQECSEAAHSAGGYIISDGGIIYPCDIVKAFGAGADFVMCGSMFAGHDESPGETVNGKKMFYGMASDMAMNKYNNGTCGYRTYEGKTVGIPLKGPLELTLNDIEGSIRSACTYTNSKTIAELQQNVQFIEVGTHHNTSLN
jgi:GMP reductase